MRRIKSGEGCVPGLAQQGSGTLTELGQRGAPRLEWLLQFAAFAAELRCLGGAKSIAGRHQPLERLAMLPVELVDGPGRHRRLGQSL